MTMATLVPDQEELRLIQALRRQRTERGLAALLRTRTPRVMTRWRTWKSRYFERLQHRLQHRVDLP